MNAQRVETGAELIEFIKNEQVMRNSFACKVQVVAAGKTVERMSLLTVSVWWLTTRVAIPTISLRRTVSLCPRCCVDQMSAYSAFAIRNPKPARSLERTSPSSSE